MDQMIYMNLQKNLHTTCTNVKEKSSVRAEKFRQNGNRMYSICRNEKDYQNAYVYYAQSIAHAPSNSREMALAYANLSAVLLKLKKYSKCLQAIDCCLSSAYPEQSKFKIYLRKIECLKGLEEPLKAKRAYYETVVWIEKNQPVEEQKIKLKKELEVCYNKQVQVEKKFTQEEVDEIWQDFSIKTFNEEIPGASSAISLKYSESLGRHYVATRDIRPGEIIVKEHPFLIVCSKSSQYICCWKCCESFANCIPCDYCEDVIFCSSKCKQEAWKEYHQLECKFLSSFFYATEIDKLVCDSISAVRILIRAVKEYGTFEKLKQAVKEMDLPSSDPRTRGFTNGQLLSDKYRAFCSLKSHSPITDTRPLATLIVEFIGENVLLFGKKLEINSQDFNLVVDWIKRYLAILDLNAYQITRFAEHIYPGTCLSIVGSFFNHSCVSNVRYMTTKLNDIAYAVLPIKKGEQVCIDYLEGISCSLEERKQLLISSFRLICNCVACKENWPEWEKYPLLKESSEMKIKIRAFLSEMKPYYGGRMDIKSQMDNKYLKNKLSQISRLLEELVANVSQPCQDVLVLKSALFQLFNKVHVHHM